ncbi:hypothetical protein GCM10023067_00820 [Aminobacter aganoensis]
MGVVASILAAAEDDHGVVAGRIGRQGFAEIGIAPVDLGADFDERGSNLAEAGVGKILDDKNAHFGPSAAQ